MYKELETFLHQIPDLEKKKPAELIDYFAYYLIVLKKQDLVTPRDIMDCFDESRLAKQSNIPRYLLNNSSSYKRGENIKFIRNKKDKGYILERHYQSKIQGTLNSSPAKIKTSSKLRDLVSKLSIEKEQSFLKEAIDCYEIGATRASIVMVWILTIYHLYEFIFNNQLVEFNAELAKNTDKRVKIKNITKIDDFTEIPENKFIEFARSAKIISNDVRKILDTKLGIRNTCAHPSTTIISEVKTTDFILDLVENVILKYS